MVESNKQLFEQNKVFSSNISDLHETVTELRERIDNLENEVHNDQQYNRNNNILISGIPDTVEHDDLLEISMNIMNKCIEDYSLTSRDFEACHRISKNSSDVVCRLINRFDVETVINNAKILKNLNKAELGLPENTTNIYVNNHLTPLNSKLAYFGRKLKNLKKIKYVSTYKGVIKYQVPTTQRDVEGHVVYRWRKISNKNDISAIFPNFEELINGSTTAR